MKSFIRFLSAVLFCASVMFAPADAVAHQRLDALALQDSYNHAAEVGLPAAYYISVSARLIPVGSKEPPPAFIKEGLGSGFVVLPNGLLMTKMHVVNPLFQAQGSTLIAPNKLKLQNGDILELFITVSTKAGVLYSALLIAGNPVDEVDLALLKIESAKGEKFSFAEIADGVVGYDPVITIGNPFGIPFTVSSGMVSNPDIVMFGRHFLQTNALMAPGSSGGMVLRLSDHKVVGMTEWIFRRTDENGVVVGPDVDLGFATQASVLQKFLNDELRKNPSLAK